MTIPLPPSQTPAAGRFPRLRLVSDDEGPAQADLSERVVLSACLLDASKITLFDWLAPEHFRLGQHRRVWAALQTLAARATGPLPEAPCLVDVGSVLQADKRLVEVGGVAALSLICDQAPDVLDLSAHAEAIHAAHQQRALGAWAEGVSATARTSPVSPAELFEGALSGLASLQAQTRLGQPPGALLGEAAAAFCDDLDSPTPSAPRLPTGFEALDSISGGGMGRGALWVLGGRPGMGKTALAQGIALNAAWGDESAAFFSMEMSRAELSARSLASESGVPSSGPLTPDARLALREAAGRIRRLPLWIDDTPGLQLGELLRRARTLAARSRAKGRRLALVVVDYLQLVSVPRQPGRKRDEEIGEVSTSLKALARELDCAVLALAQLNRESERDGRRPRMTDFRGCGQIEQDADWAGILWQRKDTPAWLVDLAICKQRGAKKSADLQLGWQADITRFSDG